MYLSDSGAYSNPLDQLTTEANYKVEMLTLDGNARSLVTAMGGDAGARWPSSSRAIGVTVLATTGRRRQRRTSFGHWLWPSDGPVHARDVGALRAQR